MHFIYRKSRNKRPCFYKRPPFAKCKAPGGVYYDFYSMNISL